MFKIFVTTDKWDGDYEELDGVLYKYKADAQVALDKVLEDPVLGLEISGYYIDEVNDDHNVLILASEEELITSLYNDYLIGHKMSNLSREDTKISVKAFSDYILEYLKDRYNLDDEEETDA